jgi:hypothetical protein
MQLKYMKGYLQPNADLISCAEYGNPCVSIEACCTDILPFAAYWFTKLMKALS